MILYSRINDHKTYAEFWGASTKHPDSMHCLQNDIEKGYINLSFENDGINAADVLQWLMFIASKKQWIFHAMDIIDTVTENYFYFQHSNVRVYD